MKNQKKEEIIFWFHKHDKIKDHQMFNPADRLGNFYLDKVTSDLWIPHTKEIINPPWLQFPIVTYFPALLDKS